MSVQDAESRWNKHCISVLLQMKFENKNKPQIPDNLDYSDLSRDAYKLFFTEGVNNTGPTFKQGCKILLGLICRLFCHLVP